MKNPTSDLKQVITQLTKARAWLIKLNVDTEGIENIIYELRRELEEAA